MLRLSSLFCSVFLFFFCGFSQISLPVPANIQKTFSAGTRSYTGAPGLHYWQNRATYNLKVFFNPSTRQLEGVAEIEYVNNSPDTLHDLVFKIYPNLYKASSPRLVVIDSADLTSGMQIQSIQVNQQTMTEKELLRDGTQMRVKTAPLLPGGQSIIRIQYSYTLNKKSHYRTGEIEEGADFVAYFFPRIAVYDDIDGWNKQPYLGRLEFYNDFCDFNAEITVPSSQVIWATGDLLNGKEVLQPAVYAKLVEAEKSDRIIDVIDSTERGKATVMIKDLPANTWKFSAKHVTDFVFACSDHYLWKSSSLVVDPKTGRRTRVDAVFNPKHKDYYEVAEFARKTVEAMSYRFPKWPYPYAHETVFDGLDQMEYPMMVNDNPLESRADVIELTDHEIFHTLFPFYMGINETKYAWMDEGWATIGEWLISPMIDSSLVDEYGIQAVAELAGTEKDIPVITISTEQNQSYFINAYPKPAMAYLFARDILGDEKFFKGLHYYITQWNGKHPMPLDFFNCMNTGSGKNLNWFWKRWFYETGITDISIVSVKGNLITVKLKGSLPLPVDLKVEYSDGKTEKIHRTAAVWEKTNQITVAAGNKNIKQISLGDPHTPDRDKKDNKWVK